MRNGGQEPSEVEMSKVERHGPLAARVVSIDAFRGFVMFWIVGGGTVFVALAKVWPNALTEMLSRQMHHAKWDEAFYLEDLIMPMFIFSVGLVLPFSVLPHVECGESKRTLYLRIVKRLALLFLLGLMVENHGLRFDFSKLHWAGVLQRIGICYFIAAVLVIHTGWRTQVAVMVALLVLGWAAMTLIPVPGYGAGVITPRGCLAAHIDQQFLPGKISEAYYGYGDSNGILPTLMSVTTAIFGALAGYWLRTNRSGVYKAEGLAIAGIICLAAGHVWGLAFPVVRLIWTSSMVLYASGYSLLLLALFYWVIDVKMIQRWAFFFIVIGMNAITIFFLRSLVNFEQIAGFFLKGITHYGPSFEQLILSIGVVAAEWLFLWFLFRHRIFLKA
jgi:predicted acyltransferase